MAHKPLFTPEFMRTLATPARPKAGATSKKRADVTHVDTLEPGKALVLRISYGGRMTWKVMFYVRTIDGEGKPRTTARAKKLGRFPDVPVAAAYAQARAFDQKKASAAASSDTFGNVAKDWLRECVDEPKLISRREVRRHLETYVLPSWKDKKIGDIGRGELRLLLDRVMNKQIRSRKRNKKPIGGRPTADAVLGTIRSLMLWYADQDDHYRCPIVRGMKLKRDKRSAKEKERSRVLNDDEIRAVWAACDQLANPGALVKLLLLTAQRLRTVAKMRWSDIDADGMWTVRSEGRGKGTVGVVKLPQMARDILDAQHKVVGNDHVFPAANSSGPRNSFSGIKRMVHALLPEGTPHWVLHDLRRTARTRMAQLGVDDRIAELTLGHEIVGIERVYNRAAQTDKKAEALKILAAHVATLLNPTPQGTNVVPLRQEPTAPLAAQSGVMAITASRITK